MIDPVVRLVVRYFDEKPPGINHLYSQRGPIRFLTTKGEKYKDGLKRATSDAIQRLGKSWTNVVNTVYRDGGYATIQCTLYLEKIHNGAWKPGTITYTDSGAMRLPYKKEDAGAYDKIIEDAVSSATGIDDCVTMTRVYSKKEAKDGKAGVVIIYKVFERNGD